VGEGEGVGVGVDVGVKVGTGVGASVICTVVSAAGSALTHEEVPPIRAEPVRHKHNSFMNLPSVFFIFLTCLLVVFHCTDIYACPVTLKCIYRHPLVKPGREITRCIGGTSVGNVLVK